MFLSIARKVKQYCYFKTDVVLILVPSQTVANLPNCVVVWVTSDAAGLNKALIADVDAEKTATEVKPLRPSKKGKSLQAPSPHYNEKILPKKPGKRS